MHVYFDNAARYSFHTILHTNKCPPTGEKGHLYRFFHDAPSTGAFAGPNPTILSRLKKWDSSGRLKIKFFGPRVLDIGTFPPNKKAAPKGGLAGETSKMARCLIAMWPEWL
jgi:hypothetical protein